MKHIFVFDRDKCCACSACMVGCMDQNDIDIAAGEVCHRRTFNEELGYDGEKANCVYLSTACMHCADAPCITACPAGCLKKDSETGFTIYDNTNCIGCKSCALACPFGAPHYRISDGKMVKCDGCNTRVKYGLKPACVMACTFGALDCVTEEEYTAREADKARDQAIAQSGLCPTKG